MQLDPILSDYTHILGEARYSEDGEREGWTGRRQGGRERGREGGREGGRGKRGGGTGQGDMQRGGRGRSRVTS